MRRRRAGWVLPRIHILLVRARRRDCVKQKDKSVRPLPHEASDERKHQAHLQNSKDQYRRRSDFPNHVRIVEDACGLLRIQQFIQRPHEEQLVPRQVSAVAAKRRCGTIRWVWQSCQLLVHDRPARRQTLLEFVFQACQYDVACCSITAARSRTATQQL